jgi:hypothetical protein
LPPSSATNFCAATKKNSFAGETNLQDREVPRFLVRHAANYADKKSAEFLQDFEAVFAVFFSGS